MSKTGNFVKLISIITVVFILISSLASCGAKTASNDMAFDMKAEAMEGGAPMDMADDYDYEYGYAEKEEAYYSKVETDSALTGNITTADPLEGRKIIKRVNVVSETKSFDSTLSAIEVEVAALGGYVQSSNVYGRIYEKYSDRRATFTLRIPAENLDSFMNTVGSLVNITNKTTNVDDITETYTDIESRLNALKVEEARLLELLSKGESLPDLLTIEQRLSEVRYEIESYTARIRGYDTLIAFSTVNIEIAEVVDYTPEPKKDPTFGDRIGEAFSESWEDFAEGCKDFAVWFVYSLPSILVLVVILFVFVFIIAGVSRRRKRRKLLAEKPKAEEETKK